MPDIICFFFFNSVKEFMDFTCKIVAERTIVGSRASVKEQGLVNVRLSIHPLNTYFLFLNTK